MTSLVQASVTLCLSSWDERLLQSSCFTLGGGWCYHQICSGRMYEQNIWLSISSFGFVHSQYLLLPGGHHCIHDNGWPQQHSNINLNLVWVCVFLHMWGANVNFTNNLDHIWGLMYSNVRTFIVLILLLKILSYPKDNHHALFITYSTTAQQCYIWKVAQNHINHRTEPLRQKIKSSFMSFTCM